MGMVYALRRATDRQIEIMLGRPRSVEHFLFEAPRQAAVSRTGLMTKLVETFGFTPLSSSLDEEREEGDEIDLDKSWHGLHFVLTGSAGATGAPLSFLVEDWPRIGDIDVGYGPAMAIKSADVARFADALSDFAEADLKQGYMPHAMLAEDVYLADFYAESADEGLDYIRHWLDELRTFVTLCVARNSGAVAYLC